MIIRNELGPLVTFVPNKNLPVYSWFYYKEGFARDFVFKMFSEFNAPKSQSFSILDPFMGVGTTLVASREYGVTGYGVDVSPLPVFAAKVKTRDYNVSEIKEWKKWLFEQKFEKRDYSVSGLVRRAFNRHILDDIIFFREIISGIPNSKIRDLFMLALINTSNKCSYAYKDGAVIKIRKKPVPPVRTMLKRTISKMEKDIKRIKFASPAYPKMGDARELPFDDESFDMIITSPPYLNKIEYTRVYSIEMELFFPYIQVRNMINSAIGADVRVTPRDISDLGTYLSPDDPEIAFKYLKDMKQSISEMHRVLKPGGTAIIVVGNGCLPNKVVETDSILADMGEKTGFKLSDIWVANQRWCTRNRTQKVGLARESVVVLEKP